MDSDYVFILPFSNLMFCLCPCRVAASGRGNYYCLLSLRLLALLPAFMLQICVFNACLLDIACIPYFIKLHINYLLDLLLNLALLYCCYIVNFVFHNNVLHYFKKTFSFFLISLVLFINFFAAFGMLHFRLNALSIALS